MKRMGNKESNLIYNPDKTKPPIPVDADEADSSMERFIRQKYQQRAVEPQRRQYSGSSSDEGPPPPLPPKPTSRFGFRSASSIFPLSSKNRTNSAPPVESLPRNNKQSKFLGATVGSDDMDAKLAKLKEMGFSDQSRNAAVLKGLGGNMEKSIETLTRIGDGSTKTKAEPRFASKGDSFESAGISFERSLPKSPQRTNNPFDDLDHPPQIAQPQSSQSTGGNPYLNQSNTNPFGLNPVQTQNALNDAFQNLSVSPQQRLFPNHTGGFPGGQQQMQLPPQSMTPPVPSIHNNHPSVIYENHVQQPQQNYNPFMQQSQPYSPPAAISPMSQPNAFGTMQSNSNPYLNQQQSYSQPLYNNTSPQPQQIDPFFRQNAIQPSPQFVYQDSNQANMSQYQQYRQQTYPLMAQQTGMRADKRSILDLYNYPQLAPQQQHNSPQLQHSTPPMSNSHFAQPSRSFSSPLATHMEVNRNPFMSPPTQMMQASDGSMGNAGPFGSQQQNGTRQISRESMAIDAGGWQNGRHSPDAWGTIARSMQ